jgi:hypothetical protein
MAIATVADLRNYLGYQPGITADDELLADALDVATDAVEQFTGRSWAATGTSEVRTFRTGGVQRAMIDDAQTVTLVEHSADHIVWIAVPTIHWWTGPENTLPKTTIVSNITLMEYVRVTGTFGVGTVPASVKRATIMMAAKLHKRRDSISGVEGFGDFGVVRVSTRQDADIVNLLSQYTRWDRSLGLA